MRSRPVLIAAPLLLAPGVLACFSGGFFDTARLRAGVLAWLLLALVAVGSRRPLPRSGPGRLALGGLAALTALTGLSLLWAPLAGPAADDLQRLLLYLPAFAAGLVLLRPLPAARATEPLLLLGVVGATLYGLSERLLPGVVSLERVVSAGDRLAYPLTYWNGTGAFAAIGLVLAVGLAGDPGRPRALRAAAAATGPLLGLAIYLTFSRGALGAAAAGLGLLVALVPTAVQLRAALVVGGTGALAAAATLALPALETAASGSGQGAAMLAVLVVLGALGAWLAPGEGRTVPLRPLRGAALGLLAVAVAGTLLAVVQAERRGGTDTPEAGAGRLASVQSNRYDYWRVALRAFGDRPLLGDGSGSFRVVWLRERPFRESVRDAHSLYLETAAELGLAGLACLLALFGGIAAGAARALRRAGPETAPALAGFVTWALHAGIDWDWELPALSLLALVLAARLLATIEPDASPRVATGPPAA
jgi:hypothetical protein